MYAKRHTSHALSVSSRHLERATLKDSTLWTMILIASLGLPFTTTAASQQVAASWPDPAPALDSRLGITSLRLWEGDAPGAKGATPEDVPTLTLMRPVHPNGTAIIIAPGGSYRGLAMNLEGREPADRMTALGITVFILKYRLFPQYIYPAPLQDARRAIRLVRSLAPRYGYSPDRIGMMGFSAGGHLTAMAATAPEPGLPASEDLVEKLPSDLNFAVLLYPWLNAMQPPVPGPHGPMINYCSARPETSQDLCKQLAASYTPALAVTSETPPIFIFHTTDDRIVPVTASINFYTALQAAGRDAELHIFAHGKHGSGTGGADPALSQWPQLLQAWLTARELLTADHRMP